MKLGFVTAVMVGAMFTVGCSARATSAGANAPVSTTTITSAPMVPDAIIPAVVWDEPEDRVAPVVETWGVKPPTEEQLAAYGF